jgi:hypothetical protein
MSIPHVLTKFTITIRRQSNLYFLPFCRTNLRQFAITYQGPKFFNSIPKSIYDAPSVYGLRKKLKEYLYLNFNFVLFKHTINVT